ncbi:B12-binding domain-containing radical SAM protein [Candidatus Omnitrophota bacterium]
MTTNKKLKKILLIHPPFYRMFKHEYTLERYPLFLGYLAGVILRDTDWDVMTYNTDFTPHAEVIRFEYMTNVGFDRYAKMLTDPDAALWQEIKATIEEFQPDVIGINTQAPLFAAAVRIAQIAKTINPRMMVLAGGPHASVMGKEVLSHPEIDVVVRGEGEVTIVELLHAIERGEDLDGIHGIIFRRNDSLVETAPRELIEDLDSLPFPLESAAQTLKDYAHYPKKAFKNIFSSRGCPFSCLFCGSRDIWGKRARLRSPENVIAEMKALVRLGLRSFRFEDDTFGIDRQWTRTLCNMIRRDFPGIAWECELHVNLVTDELLTAIKQAGCYRVQIGVESGNNAMLTSIRKESTVEEALSAAELIKRKGFELEAFFMIGFPDETEETLRDTINVLKRITCDKLVYSIFTPYPGTEAFTVCKEYGLIGDDYDITLYNHQSPHNCFCRNIEFERFRALAKEVEKIVDTKNKKANLKTIFSFNILWRIQELGIRESLLRARQFFRK